VTHAFAFSLTGGEADGAWFEGHALEGAPEEIKIAVGGEGGPALLDLPTDQLEIGEHVVVYVRRSTGHICGRGRRGGRCTSYATYEPAEGLPHPDSAEGRAIRRRVLEDAGLQPRLQAIEGGA